MEPAGISRRGALTSAASVGVTLPMLTACGRQGQDPASDRSTPGPSSSAPRASDSPTEPPRTGDADRGNDPGIASAADVPVGGGLVLAEHELVITQPTKGTFRGFTAICTHAGCTVTEVTGSIDCPCHGSRFSIDDGSVVGGPAPKPLAEVSVKVLGDQIHIEE